MNGSDFLREGAGFASCRQVKNLIDTCYHCWDLALWVKSQTLKPSELGDVNLYLSDWRQREYSLFGLCAKLVVLENDLGLELVSLNLLVHFFFR